MEEMKRKRKTKRKKREERKEGMKIGEVKRRRRETWRHKEINGGERAVWERC